MRQSDYKLVSEENVAKATEAAANVEAAVTANAAESQRQAEEIERNHIASQLEFVVSNKRANDIER